MAKQEWITRQAETFNPNAPIPLPLIRLKSIILTVSHPSILIVSVIFSVRKLANPKDVIFFYRKRAKPTNDPILKPQPANVPRTLTAPRKEMPLGWKIWLKIIWRFKILTCSPQNEFGDTVKIFVEKG